MEESLSPCLLRSFSHPSGASREPREEDLVTHALGGSISFGRFMSENLDWVKFSSFSQNRYLEEAEKCSKPGLVAQKKAYFEARYKEIAAKKAAAAAAAAALVDEANEAAAITVPEGERVADLNVKSYMDIDLVKANDHVPIDEEGKTDAPLATTPVSRSSMDTDSVKPYDHVPIDEQQKIDAPPPPPTLPVSKSSMDIDLVQANDHVPIDEEQKIDAPHTTTPVFADASRCSFDVGKNELEIGGPEGSKTVEEQQMCVKNSSEVEIPDELENVDVQDKVEAFQEEKVLVKETSDQESAGSANKKRRGNPSPKSLMHGRVSKIPSSPAKQTTLIPPRVGNNAAASSKKAVGHPIARKRLAPTSLHASINFASSIGKTSNTSNTIRQQITSSRVYSTSRTPTRASVCGTSRDSSNPSRTLNRSSICGTSKDSSNTSRTPKKLSVCGASKDSSNTSRTLQTASVNGITRDRSKVSQSLNMTSVGITSKRPSITTTSEDRRTKTQLNKSVSGAGTGSVIRKLHSLSVDNSKSLNAGGNKSRSTTIALPFSFRSDDRAAKRKKFFERIEGKIESPEAEKGQQQNGSKRKTEHNLIKLRQSTSTGLKTNSSVAPQALSLPNNHLKKSQPPPPPRSPNLGRKPADKISRTPGKPPRSEKGHKTSENVTSQPKKNASENVSPNIHK